MYWVVGIARREKGPAISRSLQEVCIIRRMGCYSFFLYSMLLAGLIAPLNYRHWFWGDVTLSDFTPRRKSFYLSGCSISGWSVRLLVVQRFSSSLKEQQLSRSISEKIFGRLIFGLLQNNQSLEEDIPLLLA